MTDFKNIETFLRRQSKAECVGNGYPHDRVINSNIFQTNLARDVERCLQERGGAIEFGKHWFNEAQRLQAEIDERQASATMTYKKNTL